ncbi:hypothetical protein CACET_c31560 [Clostridium aceticum]|uniref:Uncharacterized protein n=1 Tax=Clostridium aceticum TaxID=84022 RepID=A0A0D8I5B5_9CLOT|nr:hypothetical protein [Clostridium aceticum]AKL96600.1 hypothetical protein CACET_c31560 [Clostridium aceticum]KJF25475.1 hypothetical protein TZ02_18440 [Clostridium aceticum]
MFWKIYSIFIAVICVMTLYYSFTLLDVVWVLLAIIACIGVYGYGAKKKLFIESFWKVYFIFYVIIDQIYNWIVVPKIDAKGFSLQSLIGLLFFIPIYIGLYLYSYKNSNINEKITE